MLALYNHYTDVIGFYECCPEIIFVQSRPWASEKKSWHIVGTSNRRETGLFRLPKRAVERWKAHRRNWMELVELELTNTTERHCLTAPKELELTNRMGNL